MARQFAGNQGRLIEAAHPQPASVQRNRNQNSVLVRLQQRAHIAGHRPGESNFARVFQSQWQGSSDFAVGNGRAGSRKDWRRGQAGCTAVDICAIQRKAADHASAPQPFDLPPAVGAETVQFRDNLPAAGAARGQGEIDDPPSSHRRRLRQRLHALLSLRSRRRTSDLCPRHCSITDFEPFAEIEPSGTGFNPSSSTAPSTIASSACRKFGALSSEPFWRVVPIQRGFRPFPVVSNASASSIRVH